MPYSQHPHHRSVEHSGQKSQWTITVQEEVEAYKSAVIGGWRCDHYFWGLHLVESKPQFLGTSPSPEGVYLHIAKFVEGTPDSWHGYPVAPWLSPYDKPGMEVLKAWEVSGFISKSTRSRIHRGKRCAL
jgi:hypothetical protein